MLIGYLLTYLFMYGVGACSHACSRMLAWVCACQVQMLTPGDDFYHSALYFLRHNLSLVLKLDILASMLASESPGCIYTHSNPHPYLQHQGYRCRLCLAFIWMLGIQTKSICLHSQHFTTELSPLTGLSKNSDGMIFKMVLSKIEWCVKCINST